MTLRGTHWHEVNTVDSGVESERTSILGNIAEKLDQVVWSEHPTIRDSQVDEPINLRIVEAGVVGFSVALKAS